MFAILAEEATPGAAFAPSAPLCMSMRRRRSISSSMLVIREEDDEVTDISEDALAAAAAEVELDIVVIVRLSGSVDPVRDSRSESSTEAG